ncbi:MAG: ABC transporter ATP-binding protein/permease [Gracilibacteraceae bacterium]|jgi:ABC-type transport system involved in cytochrome bd biosynthesis fused ATPase/permease subunit|nr:ABC transporter ATP-binding protein/permease [Gracilibacteraceae bacterium]
MIERRLLNLAPQAKRAIAKAVAARWCALLADVLIITGVTGLIGRTAAGTSAPGEAPLTLLLCLLAALARALCGLYASRASFAASAGVKKQLREKLYDHLTALGPGYTAVVGTAELLQVAAEGVDQLEIYFGRYLPQFFYSLVAPATLFLVMAPIDLKAACVLLAAAPLIPLLLIIFRRVAGKMAGRQWNSYISLGDRFLENIQGMTTLKVYGADAARQEDMTREAESFRQATMRLLRMQLSSFILMDLAAFGGAAAGIAAVVLAYGQGRVPLSGALALVLLSAEYFIPLRQLGSYFHIALNGVSAGERMFQFLNLTPPPAGTVVPPPGRLDVKMRGVSFAYPGGGRSALSDVALDVPAGRLTALAGVSGCGKSTVAALLAGRRRGYSGGITLGGAELRDIDPNSLQRRVTLVNHDGYIFAGTAADNLRLARPEAEAAEMVRVLRAVRLWDFLAERGGLAAAIGERGTNLSGGQRQRLCIARALLRDSDLYIFDEAASNIDVESEEAVMAVVRRLAESKAVLLISHRLTNLVTAGRIYLMENGRISEAGAHAELLARRGGYARLYREQVSLENYGNEVIRPESVG